MDDTIWADDVWASGVWAAGVWADRHEEEPEAPVEPAARRTSRLVVLLG